ncbi:hypothetical protein ZOSMA_143G00010 [Zostera marina]|uniref:Transcription initiation factor TFIID subunit 2 TPR repeats domain-containing protein n=1 Tax=Zostera marina TaxID=29655 RepID=A0A0K9PXP3_ZOSMR|nr:hypothetical protein ZOSMA_143G00010 [Zostera marina]
MVRSLDKKSPREAIEFILQLLKYNDNNGNPYSDVYWLATLIQSIGELELGKQHISFITSLLKRLERFLQSDRSTPSYNWILTMACIQTLTQIGLKTPSVLPLVYDWIKSFRNFEYWKVRLQANKSLLSLEFYNNGLDAALSLFLDYLDEESCFRGM